MASFVEYFCTFARNRQVLHSGRLVRTTLKSQTVLLKRRKVGFSPSILSWVSASLEIAKVVKYSWLRRCTYSQRAAEHPRTHNTMLVSEDALVAEVHRVDASFRLHCSRQYYNNMFLFAVSNLLSVFVLVLFTILRLVSLHVGLPPSLGSLTMTSFLNAMCFVSARLSIF